MINETDRPNRNTEHYHRGIFLKDNTKMTLYKDYKKMTPDEDFPKLTQLEDVPKLTHDTRRHLKRPEMTR